MLFKNIRKSSAMLFFQDCLSALLLLVVLVKAKQNRGGLWCVFDKQEKSYPLETYNCLGTYEKSEFS